MDEKKIKDIVILHVEELIPITSYFVIGTGLNKKQAEAVMEDIKKESKKMGLQLYGFEGDGGDFQWILMDYGEVIIHLFEETWRDHYGLEMLWGDAPKVEWKKEIKQ
ncbi:MAG: ribosome silencing factor [Planctomycetota bacterium]|nr:MAG: ribosome silencing factor [Planctomycetota bacterium]